MNVVICHEPKTLFPTALTSDSLKPTKTYKPSKITRRQRHRRAQQRKWSLETPNSRRISSGYRDSPLCTRKEHSDTDKWAHNLLQHLHFILYSNFFCNWSEPFIHHTLWTPHYHTLIPHYGHSAFSVYFRVDTWDWKMSRCLILTCDSVHIGHQAVRWKSSKCTILVQFFRLQVVYLCQDDSTSHLIIFLETF